MHPVDCHTCGRPLGRKAPVLVVDNVADHDAELPFAAVPGPVGVFGGRPARCPQLTGRRGHGVQAGIGNELMHPRG